MATRKKYLIGFIKNDELLSCQMNDLKEGEKHILENYEEYTIILKLKHIKNNWRITDGSLTS